MTTPAITPATMRAFLRRLRREAEGEDRDIGWYEAITAMEQFLKGKGREVKP